MTAYYANSSSSSQYLHINRIRAVTDLLVRAEGITAQAVADTYGISRPWLYQLTSRLLEAVAFGQPGPSPESSQARRVDAEIASLRAENRTLRTHLAEVAAEKEAERRAVDLRLERFVLAGHGWGLSVRGIEDLSAIAIGEGHRVSKSRVQRALAEHGRVAEGLVKRGRELVRDDITCLAADDIYFKGADVKVAIEPVSTAVLCVGHWDGTTGDDWAAWLEEFENLQLLVSDLGGDLLAAADILGVDHCADLFHELRTFERTWLTPLQKAAATASEQWWRALEQATSPDDPHAMHDEEDNECTIQAALCAEAKMKAAEDDYYTAAVTIDGIVRLYRPRDLTTGRPWTDAGVRRALAEIETTLASIGNKSVRATALRHLARHRERFASHRRALDTIDVPIREGSSWSPRRVIDTIALSQHLDRQIYDHELASKGGDWRDLWRIQRTLDKKLRRACTDPEAVAERMREVMAVTLRSSSIVESFNARLRVAQTIRRNVDDPLLALVALRWNLTPGDRRGRAPDKTPYQLLGVPIGEEGERWFDTLLREEALLNRAA